MPTQLIQRLLLLVAASACAAHVAFAGPPPATFGGVVNGFAGLQFAIAQGGVSTPVTAGSGYAVADMITLQCPGVTFSVSPVLGVTGVTSGAVNGTTVATAGVTSGTLPAGSIVCSQASTTGSGTGFTATVTFGVIAAYVNVPTLASSGGLVNGNFFLNNWEASVGANPHAGYYGGSESTFIGDKAGAGLWGSNSSLNTAVGHNALGNGGTGSGSLANACLGEDCFRNIEGTGGHNTGLGSGAGRNIDSGYDVYLGYEAAGYSTNDSAGRNTGGYNTAVGALSLTDITSGTDNLTAGYESCQTVTTGSYNICLGYGVGSTTLTTGSNDILIGTSSAIDANSASASNELNIAGLIFGNTNSIAAPSTFTCGTSPSVDTHANNRSGTLTAGTGTVTSCAMTLAGTGFAVWDHCIVAPHGTYAGFAYSYTLTAITITGTSLAGDVFNWECDGY
jgi:hypothetical protein